MGLATRVIPTVLHRNGRMVKGRCFRADRVVGSALQATRIHQARGVDELVVLDIAATPEGRGPDLFMIEELADGCFSPVTVGGGVRSVEDVRGLLNAGADKAAICTAAFRYPDLIGEVASVFGRQCVVAVIEHIGGLASVEGGKALTCDPVVTWAQEFEAQGAGEILLNSVDRDGTMQGYDLDLIREISHAVSIPVIASGGCYGYEDMYQAIKAGASAVAAGALFLFTDCTPRGAAQYLAERGVEVRL